MIVECPSMSPSEIQGRIIPAYRQRKLISDDDTRSLRYFGSCSISEEPVYGNNRFVIIANERLYLTGLKKAAKGGSHLEVGYGISIPNIERSFLLSRLVEMAPAPFYHPNWKKVFSAVTLRFREFRDKDSTSISKGKISAKKVEPSGFVSVTLITVESTWLFPIVLQRAYNDCIVRLALSSQFSLDPRLRRIRPEYSILISILHSLLETTCMESRRKSHPAATSKTSRCILGFSKDQMKDREFRARAICELLCHCECEPTLDLAQKCTSFMIEEDEEKPEQSVGVRHQTVLLSKLTRMGTWNLEHKRTFWEKGL
ncbi:hypothetical protein BJ742DRAFT_474691 [Cladochytrium replicatum]|nr:hypothetical protein BJ742DRAFT_474691 [Cladochytrium replicatum]